MADAPELYGSGVQGYIDGVIANAWPGMSDMEISKILGIHYNTLAKWKTNKVDWDYVMRERRKLYKNEILAVDGAMLKEAKKGNVQAAQLVYARFDGYVPSSAILNIEATCDDDLKLRAEAIKSSILAEEKNGVPGIRHDLPGTGEAGTV